MKKKNLNTKPNVEMYTPYLGGEMDVDEIERLFQEKDKMTQKGFDTTSANMKLLHDNATPEYLPVDVFMELDESNSENEDLFNFAELPYGDSDLEELFFEGDYDPDDPTHRKILESYFRATKFGSYYELWPKARLDNSLPFDPFDYPIFEFPNYQDIALDNELDDQFKETKYINLNHLTLESVLPHIPNNAEAIVLDPPCIPNRNITVEDDHSEWGFHDLVSLFTSIREKTEFCFILIWIDPENVNTIISAAGFAQLIFADSCVIELFEGNLEPLNISADFNIQRHSRMLFIYKTMESSLEMFAKQRSRDATWGVIAHGGKSRGRLGMPPIPHSIVEGFLPIEKDPRIFIELWPSRLQPHPNWILIDEIDPKPQENDIGPDNLNQNKI